MQCIASPVQVRGAGAGVLRRVPGQRDGAERERRLPRLSRQEPRGPARELPPGKYYIISVIIKRTIICAPSSP